MPSPRLSLRLAQRVHVGTDLRKALRFLQLPGVELRDELRREILENPCLELDEEEGAEPLWGPARECRRWERPAAEDWMSREIPARPPTLGEHLRAQAALLPLRNGAVRAALFHSIGCLDERGYLTESSGEIARFLGVEESIVHEALGALRSLDPPGVGAADLPDCLGLQLERRPDGDPLARRLVAEAWPLLPRGTAKVAAALGTTERNVLRAVRSLRRLSPHPGHQFDPAPERAIWPDVVVREVDGRLVAWVEERSQPRLRYVRSMALPADPEAARFLGEKRREARWLLRALERRRATLLRVAEEILRQQEGFFRRGPEGLRPLTLKEVALAIGLHESTVARVTLDKYADTPRGLLSLRFFFSGRIRRAGPAPARGRGDHAVRAVRERIRELIREEPPGCPVSDRELVERLASEGVRIARRTVAKYRDQMGIPRAQLRGLAVPAA